MVLIGAELMVNPPQRATGLPAALAATPWGVLRPVDGSAVYTNPQAEFRRLESRGLLRRVATGYYATVPAGRAGDRWQPTLEAAAFGIAAADYGSDAAVLMGLSAARLHGAIPRALAVAVVAVPKQRPMVQLIDRPAHIRFVRRDVARLDAERLPTDLGTALVTTVEQTVLDLAHRPDLGGVEDESWSAIAVLWARADPQVLTYIAETQRLASALRRARQHVASDA
jgi:predicted transcriptional regulator of viral defense system